MACSPRLVAQRRRQRQARNRYMFGPWCWYEYLRATYGSKVSLAQLSNSKTSHVQGKHTAQCRVSYRRSDLLPAENNGWQPSPHETGDPRQAQQLYLDSGTQILIFQMGPEILMQMSKVHLTLTIMLYIPKWYLCILWFSKRKVIKLLLPKIRNL